MAQSSFVQRQLEFTITLAPGTQLNQPVKFSNGSNSVVLSGFRSTVRIENSGRPAGSIARVSVFGLSLSIMNQLSTLGMVLNIIPRNTIIIRAGDSQTPLAKVFGGTITDAYGNFDASPNVPFQMIANSGLADAIVNSDAASFTGSTAVATIMKGFADKMGLTFENSGVNAVLDRPVFRGNLLGQVYDCAQQANINAEIINGDTLAIWPRLGFRNTTGGTVLLSKDSGMIGYPSYTSEGILVKSVFNPAITYGGTIKVQTIIKPIADIGLWAINKMDLALDAQVPRGQWMTTINAYNPHYPRPVVS